MRKEQGGEEVEQEDDDAVLMMKQTRSRIYSDPPMKLKEMT